VSVVVFLGPSLPVAAARAVLDATYLPPCRMGDVFVAAQGKPKAIVIIDGYFEQTPAVWHKEILHAMAQGIVVFGGSSMGALRAAELRDFGMVGVGRVFEDYASGVLEDDDEVAVQHLPQEAGYACRSDAMVNLRHGLSLAREAGVISTGTHDRLLRRAKAEHYPQRSWHALFTWAPEAGLDAGEVAALRGFVASHGPDLKRDDALATLRAVVAWREHGAPPAKVDYEFQPTVFWEHLRTYFAPTRAVADGQQVAHERLVQHVRLARADRAPLRERALLLFLVEQEARRLGLGRAEPKAALERFRRRRDLGNAAALGRWLEREHVSQQECLDLAALEIALRDVEARYAEQVNQRLATALKLQGHYGDTVERVEDKWRRLRALGLETPAESDVESIDAVLEWYQRQFGRVHGDLVQHAAELGFGSMRQFLSELLAEYLHSGVPDHGPSYA
jgi:hypothetical protein